MSKAYITINERKIGPGFPVYIIAEIGINHNGSLELALDMIQAAKKCGADAVKFQIITSDRCYTRQSPSYKIFKKIEFKKSEWKIIFDSAKSLGIDCFATFVDRKDMEEFSDFLSPAIKISSSNITNIPLLEYTAKLGLPVLLSSGMSDFKEVKNAIKVLRLHGQKEIAIFQCTSLYPAAPETLNLKVIPAFMKEFPACPIGFSDHSRGILAAAASVALGAVLIEKHFTLNKKMRGADHHFSADLNEFKEMVRAVREVETMLGSAAKEPFKDELKKRCQFRRIIVATKDIAVGEILSKENIGLKRSVTKGFEPFLLRQIIGRRSRYRIRLDSPITKDMLA